MRRRSEGEERVARKADEAGAIGAQEQRMLALGIRPEAGNHAIGRMIARVKQKRVEGHLIDVAETREEAIKYCSAYANENGVDWDAIGELGHGTIIGLAMKAKDDQGVPAGLQAAYKMLLTDKKLGERADESERRREEMDERDSDYHLLRRRFGGNGLLVATIDEMKRAYVGCEPGPINVSLPARYTRASVEDAVERCVRSRGWVTSNLSIVSNLHGFEVSEKDEQLGDTLDTRGDQGNLIATWGGTVINVHINPSD